MHKYIMFGPQGAGKSTHSRLLEAEFDFVRIGIGDMLRWHVDHRTKLGGRVRRTVEAGQLVPDQTVETVVQDRLQQHDWSHGLVIDGFPRNLVQAQYLWENWNFDKVIHLDVPDNVVVQRVLARTRAGWGAGFTKRADDDPRVIERRLAEYHTQTEPLLERYRKREMLVHVDATRPISEVYSWIKQLLGLR